MVEYRVNNLTAAPVQVSWHTVLQNGADTQGPRALIDFGSQRKGITRVPMGWVLNGDVTAVLGTAIMTDNMAGCEAIAVFGCDNLHHPVRVGFTHVWGGYPDNVNWVSLMNGIAVHPNRYALVECNRIDSSDDRLYLSLRDSYGIPDGNILIYNKGVGESGGRTFGIDNTGNFGEAPAGLVERQKAARLDNVLKQQNFMRKNPGVRYDDKFSMKVKK